MQFSCVSAPELARRKTSSAPLERAATKTLRPSGLTAIATGVSRPPPTAQRVAFFECAVQAARPGSWTRRASGRRANEATKLTLPTPLAT